MQAQRWVQVVAPRQVVVMKDQVEVEQVEVVEAIAAEMVLEVVEVQVAVDLPSRPDRAHPM